MSRSIRNVDGIVLTALMIGGALLARRGSARAWSRVAGEEPPPEHDNDHVSMGKALAWAVTSGTAVGLSRIIVRRIVGYRGKPV